jgi:hypothetical protein
MGAENFLVFVRIGTDCASGSVFSLVCVLGWV